MDKNRRRIGSEREKQAGAYLETLGYEILDYNFYTRFGEIDIVAKHNGYLVFVEVKYRSDSRKGHPFDAISVSKQKTISKCALFYMNQKHLTEVPVRFDVVGVLGEDVKVIPNAFDFIM